MARNGRGRHPAPDEPRVSPAEKARLAALNGMRGGRPPGKRNELPSRTAEAFRRLSDHKFRLSKETPVELTEDASEVLRWARSRVVDVAQSRVHSRKSPSVLKAALAIMDEVGEPIAKEIKHSGTLGIAAAVAEVNSKLAAARAAGPQLPPGSPTGVGPFAAPAAREAVVSVVPIKKSAEGP